MDNPVLHVKDSYYFEVPKWLWNYNSYTSVDQFPAWIRVGEKENHWTLEDYQHELAGKILIPQPFGNPKNLYETYSKADEKLYPEQYANSGFCISKFMVIQFVVAGLLIFFFSRLASHVSSHRTPKGRLWNLMEAFLVFLRDQVIRPSIDGDHDDHGEHHDHKTNITHGDPRHDLPDDHKFGYQAGTVHPIVAADGIDAVPGLDPHVNNAPHMGAHGHQDHAHDTAHAFSRESDKFLPFLWTLFFFILICNLFGILPWLGSPTGAFSTTLVLAGCTMLAGLIGGHKKFGAIGYWLNQIPSMELPLILAVFLKPGIFIIEVAGLAIKHVILAFRLLANMVAGHLVIAGIMGMITASAAAYMTSANPSEFSYWLTVSLACIGSALFFILELFVAFLQAYVFVFLSSLFIGAAVHKH